MARLLTALLAFAMTAALSAQATISGAWELNINGPEGVITATADLKQDGEKVTGTINSPQGSTTLTGTYKAKKMEVSFSIQSPNGPLDIKVNGDVDGDEMKGIIDFGMGMADFTAKKQ